MYSSLYGQCVFSTKTAANTALADELLAAAKTPLFAANALKLQADFNKTLLDYETSYWNLTSIGRTSNVLPRTLLSIPSPYLHQSATASVGGNLQNVVTAIEMLQKY